ncbi:uncharacterized protein LOC135709451 isoform X2 [Ochlerotatus camptorhynchus]|uniref:uncharacterized protein LOC135709451 isoform X2 n=1 Tax=Ochlerotatus camptorhynchus TaxID=644619 RepID=UPI0031DBF388
MCRAGAEFQKLEHSGGRRCCHRFAKLRPVKMRVPSSVAAGLKLDNGINYVKCAAARNNASIAPIYRLNSNSNSRAPVLLESIPRSGSSISISGPSGGDDLAQQQREDNSNRYSSLQSRPRGRRRGRRRPKCVWMWRRWFNSLPSLVSSLLVSIPANLPSPSSPTTVPVHLSQLRPLQQKKYKSQKSLCQADSVASYARKEAEEEKEENDNLSAVAVNGSGSECENSDYSQPRVTTGSGSSSRGRWHRPARSCHRSSSSSVLGGIFGGIDVKLVLVIMVLIGVIDYSEAGTCWLRRIESTGKCNKLFARNVTREHCCHAGTGLGFSDQDITDVQIFFVNAFNDGMDCSSCLDSCEKAKCGVNKRCVMKKGRPKCICAPNCKAPKQAKPLTNQSIKVINLSESQRNRRQYFSSGPRVAASRMTPPSPLKQGGGSNNKRSVRLLGDEPSSHQHHSRTVKTSLSEKTISQRSSNGKLANSKRKDNLLETVTLVNSRSRGDGGSRMVNHTERPTDRMVLMADGPVQINSYARKSRFDMKQPILVTSSSANVRHRNRKVSNGYNQTDVATHRVHDESSSRTPQHHSRDFGKPRLLRLESSGKDNQTVDARVPRRPPHLEEMFYVPQNRRGRLRGGDFDFGNEITQHTGFYNPVCGTDGKTYKTECQLKKRACRQESTTLVMAYKGHCQTSCRFVQCPDGKHCVEDQNSTPHCVTCTMDCPPVDTRTSASATKAVVCGTDGITYRNICELKRKACLTGRAIPVAYRGRCIEAATCDTIKCKDRQQCLTDLQSHNPRCVSCSYKCPRTKRPQQGRTRQFGGNHGGGNQQRNQHHQPNVKLCGTNNHTYHSWCHMLRDSCNTGFYIDVQYNGVCNFERSLASPSILAHSVGSVKP